MDAANEIFISSEGSSFFGDAKLKQVILLFDLFN